MNTRSTVSSLIVTPTAATAWAAVASTRVVLKAKKQPLI